MVEKLTEDRFVSGVMQSQFAPLQRVVNSLARVHSDSLCYFHFVNRGKFVEYRASEVAIRCKYFHFSRDYLKYLKVSKNIYFFFYKNNVIKFFSCNFYSLKIFCNFLPL